MSCDIPRDVIEAYAAKAGWASPEEVEKLNKYLREGGRQSVLETPNGMKNFGGHYEDLLKDMGRAQAIVLPLSHCDVLVEDGPVDIIHDEFKVLDQFEKVLDGAAGIQFQDTAAPATPPADVVLSALTSKHAAVKIRADAPWQTAEYKNYQFEVTYNSVTRKYRVWPKFNWFEFLVLIVSDNQGKGVVTSSESTVVTLKDSQVHGVTAEAITMRHIRPISCK